MKKSLIALAVAGLVSAPAFAATSNVDVYGIMHIALEDTDATDASPGVVDNASRLGFKGSEDLGGGLKAIWQIESQLTSVPAGSSAAANGVGTGSLAGRNTFIGLAGGFGTLLMGRHDTPYKISTTQYNVFADTIADYAGGRLDGVKLTTGHNRVNNAIAYISPSMSGFTAAVALVAVDNLEFTTATPPVAVPGVTDDKSLDALSATLMYANGPISASLSYDDLGDLAGKNGKSNAWKLGAGYVMGDTKLGFIYEDVDTGAAASDRDSWMVSVAHSMGPIALKAQYGQADVGVGAGSDQDMWAVGADYNLSKRTAAFIVYGNGDNDAASDLSGWNIGMRHSF
jgi:predicted porin